MLMKSRKRLVVCCDGTWGRLDNPYPTNVVKLAQAVTHSGQDEQGHDIRQVVYYDEGLGTNSRFERLPGGAFGIGIDKDIQDAYRFLCLNYEEGDEIYLFGFSRGAYTVRSLAGLINYCGLLDRQHLTKTPEAYEAYRFQESLWNKFIRKLKLYAPRENQDDISQSKDSKVLKRHLSKKFREFAIKNYQQDDEKLVEAFRKAYGGELCRKFGKPVEINFLGCWDTVGQLGIPNLNLVPTDFLNRWINRRHSFHNHRLSSIIKFACHAVAIDEQRRALDVTLMEPNEHCPNQLRQIWFSGVHGCVGGGNGKFEELSDIALLWMVEQIKKNLGGELVDLAKLPSPASDYAPIHQKIQSFREGFHFLDLGGHYYRKIPFNKDAVLDEEFLTHTFHESVVSRWQIIKAYQKTKNLENFKEFLEKAVLGLQQVVSKTTT